LADYLFIVPVGMLANALPISFGGLGLMEGAFMKLFGEGGLASATEALALGLMTRLLIVLWALPGGLCALGPLRERVAPVTVGGGAAVSAQP